MPVLTTQAPIKSRAENEIPAWSDIASPTGPFLLSVQKDLTSQADEFHPEIRDCAYYALGVQGKQIRPILFGLSLMATGSELSRIAELHDKLSPSYSEGVEVAAIIEMVHLATLAHDDILDEADIRRGQPTLARKWGNEIAVLLGDCLFACALERAALLKDPFVFRKLAVATRRVCFGEALQAHQRLGFTMQWSEYLDVIASKTAELFALSCELGGFIGGADEFHRKALADFGMSLGVAYQMYDDCVDLFGAESQAGKSLRTDLEKGKLTLPTLIILNESPADDSEALLNMLKNVSKYGSEAIVGRLNEMGALERSVDEIRGRLKVAEKALDSLPDSTGKERLIQICHYLARQTTHLGVG